MPRSGAAALGWGKAGHPRKGQSTGLKAIAIPLEARAKPAGAGCPRPAEVMEAQPFSCPRGRSRSRYWKQVCCPAGRWEPLGRKPLKEIYVRLSSPLSPETNYTPVLPRSGGPARLRPPRVLRDVPARWGRAVGKTGSAVESRPAPRRPPIHLAGSPAGGSRSTWAATPLQPPLGSRTLAPSGERGGTKPPPSSSAFPEVYYYTNVNSRTGIWGAAAGS